MPKVETVTILVAQALGAAILVQTWVSKSIGQTEQLSLISFQFLVNEALEQVELSFVAVVRLHELVVAFFHLRFLRHVLLDTRWDLASDAMQVGLDIDLLGGEGLVLFSLHQLVSHGLLHNLPEVGVHVADGVLPRLRLRVRVISPRPAFFLRL